MSGGSKSPEELESADREASTDEEEGEFHTGPFGFRARLESSGDLSSPPWQQLSYYASLGLGTLIFLPFVCMLVHAFVVKQAQPAVVLHHVLYQQDIRIVRSMFSPIGLYVGTLLVFLFFVVCLSLHEKWRLAADGWAVSLEERLLSCVGRTRSYSTHAKSSWKTIRLCMFVVCVTAVPCMAWCSPLLWWETAAGRFRDCSSACKHAEEEDDKLLCKTWDMPSLSRINEHPPTPEEEKTCFKLFKKVHNTTYIAAMIKDSHSFLMFEAILRQTYAISILDIYGPLLGCIILVVVVSARMALRQEARMLAKFKFQYIRDHMVTSEYEMETYKRLLMSICRRTRQDLKESWVTRLLVRIDEKLHPGNKDDDSLLEELAKTKLKELAWDAANEIEGETEGAVLSATTPEKAGSAEGRSSYQRGKREKFVRRDDKDRKCGRAFQHFEEDDDVNDRETLCSDTFENLRVIALTIVFAVVDAVIPCSARSMGSDGTEPFFANARFEGVVLPSVAVTLLSDVALFGFLLHAHSRHKAQVERVIAFDCLWRFPEEDLLHSVTRDTYSLLRPGQHQHYQGGDFTQGADGVKLQQLGRWFHLRQYLQLDQIDERVSTEVAITVAVLMLLPRFTIFAVNLLVMGASFWNEQAVNFQLAWAMIWTLGVTIQSLTVTLTLNDLFDRHLQRLAKLVEEIKLQKSLENHSKRNVTTELENDSVICAVNAMIEVLRTSDAPSTLFGITVNRKMLAGYVALTAASIVPQGVVILRSFMHTVASSM